MIDLLHAEAVTGARNQNPVLLEAFNVWCNEFVPALLDEVAELRRRRLPWKLAGDELPRFVPVLVTCSVGIVIATRDAKDPGGRWWIDGHGSPEFVDISPDNHWIYIDEILPRGETY